MGLFDKVKNLFTEEVEETVIEKKEEEPIKKEVIQVEIPSPAKTRQEMHTYEEEEEKPKEENKFPFFDDKDFDMAPKAPEVKKPTYRAEVYNPPKEEKKVFKPSPIISPVYGILDKNYQKDELKVKDDSNNYYNSKEASLDAIRKKAYGNLDSDLEMTLLGKKKTEEKVEMIDKALEDGETDSYDAKIIGEKPRHGAEETDLTDLLEEEMSKTETKSPRKISDSELFNLIDSMYESGDKK